MAQHESNVNFAGDVSSSINYIPYDPNCPTCALPCAYSPFMLVQCIRSKQKDILAQMQKAESTLENMQSGTIYYHQKEKFCKTLREARVAFEQTVLGDDVVDGIHTLSAAEKDAKLNYQATLIAAIAKAHTTLTDVSTEVNAAMQSMPTKTRTPVTDQIKIEHTAEGGVFFTDEVLPALDKEVDTTIKLCIHL